MDVPNGIKLDLSVTDRRIDLIREGFDIAVRIGELEDTTLIGRSLGVLHYVLGASPKYLQRRGIPQAVDDLKRHACLRHLLGGRPQPFTFADGTRIVPDGPFDSDDAQSLIEAAIKGVGITSSCVSRSSTRRNAKRQAGLQKRRQECSCFTPKVT